MLLFRFLAGTALRAFADNGGAVSYGSFHDIRVRYAKIGIHLESTGVLSAFVNSLLFVGGVISGSMEDYGILVTGPGAVNQNVFQAMVVEPYKTNHGHLVVRGPKSWVDLQSCRLEVSIGTHGLCDKSRRLPYPAASASAATATVSAIATATTLLLVVRFPSAG